jgi:hypothetical protein
MHNTGSTAGAGSGAAEPSPGSAPAASTSSLGAGTSTPPTIINAAATVAAAGTPPTIASAQSLSPPKRPASAASTSSSSLGTGHGSGSARGGFVDVLRSMGQLTLCNAPQIQEELRGVVRSSTGSGSGAGGSRRGRGAGGSSGGGSSPEEAAALLAELASLASCLNELVASAVGEAAAAGADGAEGGEGSGGGLAGGGAVAVGGRLLGGNEEGEGGGLHLHSAATLVPPAAHGSGPYQAQQYHALQQLLQQHQQHLHLQLSHAASAPSSSLAAAAVVAADEEDEQQRPSPVLAVLGDAALLHYVLEFVAAPAMPYRRQLGTLALVSRQWRDLAHSERFWRPIVLQLFPRLSPTAVDHDEDEAAAGGTTGAGTGTGTGTAAAVAAATSTEAVQQHQQQHQQQQQAAPGAEWYRKYLVQYGRCLFEHPIRQGPWHEGITLSFDLHDEQDGTRLFSSTGPIRFTGTTIPGITAMKLTGRRRRVTTPFSAAGRDPTGHLASIEELFQEGDSPDYPVAFTIRVTARDERTGKMALLFSSAKRTKRWVEPLGEDMGVPQGTLLVNQGWARVTIPGTDLAMQMLTVFYVAPVEAQAQAQAQAQGQAAQQGQQGGPPPPLQQHGGGGGGQQHPQPPHAQPQQPQQVAAAPADGGNAPPPAGGMAVAGGAGGAAAGGGGGGGGGGNGNGPADPAHRQYAVLTLDCAFMLQCKTEVGGLACGLD